MPSRWHHVPKTSPPWHEQITFGTGGDSTSKSGEAGAVCFLRSESREAYQAPEPETKPLAAVVIALVDVRYAPSARRGRQVSMKSSQEKRRNVVFRSRGPR